MPSLGNLGKDVLERRTSSGSVLFAFFDIVFAHIFQQIVSLGVKTKQSLYEFGNFKAHQKGKDPTSG